MDYFLFNFSGVQFHYTMSPISKHIKICFKPTIKYLTLTTKYARGKIIIIYQRNCSAQAIEVG